MKPAFVFILLFISAAVGLAWEAKDDDNRDGPKLRSAREVREMRDFLGAVYRGQGAMNITSGRLAQGSEGSIVRTGNTFTTPRGVYVKVGDNWFLPDGEGSVRRVGSSFLGPKGAVIKTGQTYLGGGGNAVAAGQAVFRNYPKHKKEDDE